jgi:sugar/nucleoside kinase (ribokinase family)
VGFGENSVDFVAVVAEYPEPHSKHRLQHFARVPGGQIATALAACARLGYRARYLGSFGDDALGVQSRESMAALGIDVSAARIVAGATNRCALILVEAGSGERTVLWDRHPDLAMTPAFVMSAAVRSGRVLLVDGTDGAASAQAAREARSAGMATIIDVETVFPGIEDILPSIDAIIAAREFPAAFTGHQDLGRALEAIGREFRAGLVCVTLGPEGSLAWCHGREIRTPSFAVECIDSTGAGDAFRGGFAAACLGVPDGDIEDVLLYANAVGALGCRAFGAQGSLPTADEVERLLLARRKM